MDDAPVPLDRGYVSRLEKRGLPGPARSLLAWADATKADLGLIQDLLLADSVDPSKAAQHIEDAELRVAALCDDLNYDEALGCALEIHARTKSQHSHFEHARASLLVARALRAQSRWRASRHFIEKAQALADGSTHLTARVLIEQTRVSTALGHLRLAGLMLAEAERLADHSQLDRSELVMLRGEIEIAAEDHGAAAATLESAAELAAALPSNAVAARAHVLVAHCRAQRGHSENVVRYLDLARDYARSSASLESRAHVEMLAGETQLLLGDYSGAEAAFRAAEQIYARAARTSLRVRSLLGLVRVCRARGDHARQYRLLRTVRLYLPRASDHACLRLYEELTQEPSATSRSR